MGSRGAQSPGLPWLIAAEEGGSEGAPAPTPGPALQSSGCGCSAPAGAPPAAGRRGAGSRRRGPARVVREPAEGRGFQRPGAPAPPRPSRPSRPPCPPQPLRPLFGGGRMPGRADPGPGPPGVPFGTPGRRLPAGLRLGAESVLRPRPGVEVTLRAQIGAFGRLGMEEPCAVRRGPQLGGEWGPALPACSRAPATPPRRPTTFPSWSRRRHRGRTWGARALWRPCRASPLSASASCRCSTGSPVRRRAPGVGLAPAALDTLARVLPVNPARPGWGVAVEIRRPGDRRGGFLFTPSLFFSVCHSSVSLPFTPRLQTILENSRSGQHLVVRRWRGQRSCPQLVTQSERSYARQKGDESLPAVEGSCLQFTSFSRSLFLPCFLS